MLKTFFYRIFYFPAINLIVRSILILFKKYLPNSMKIPVSGILKIKTDKNKNIKFLSNESCPMVKVLFWKGSDYSFEFTSIFNHLAKKSNTFLDIGSNVGYYSLMGKTVNPAMKVYAFEPSLGPKYFLKENIRLNGFDSIVLIDKALGNYHGTIDFYEEKNPKYPYLKHHASGIGNTVNSWGIENFSKYTVELTTVDQIIKDLKIESIDLIKMDTEGTENLVLEGGIESILKHQPIIICEVLKDHIESEIQDIVLNKLKYKIFQFQSKSNTLKAIDKFDCDNSEPNYFFVPEQRINELETFIVPS